MLVVGLTGGIGSGKSSLATELAALGLPVVDADEVPRRCAAPGTAGLAAIVDHFGTEVLAADGSLDRPALAALVFVDADARRDLEAITHPFPPFAMLPDLPTIHQTLTAIAGALNVGGVAILHVLNFARLPDGPIVWQKGRRITADGVEWFLTKGVHRAGERAFVDVAPLPRAKSGDTLHFQLPVTGRPAPTPPARL